MSDPVKLITHRDKSADEVVAWLEKALDVAKSTNCCGVAVALVRPNGAVSTVTFGKGSRVLLLGAVTDLQHTLAKSGHEP